MKFSTAWLRLCIQRPLINVSLTAALLLALYSSTQPANEPYYTSATTFDKFLGHAVNDDPDAQNFIGFMLFHGEGVERDLDEAHYWFHRSAEQGNVLAQRNLGMLHSRAIKDVPEEFENAEEANHWFTRIAVSGHADGPGIARTSRQRFFSNLEESLENTRAPEDAGELVYISYCAGCHGFDGMAAYPSTPSFARGERLEKTDAVLMQGMLDGLGVMPQWRDTLSTDLLHSTLAYIRNRLHASAADEPIAGEGRQVVPEDRIEVPDEGSYVKFCAGCHGLNGVAYYVNSPSFALGQRLDKSDEELARSITNGHGEMPRWGDLIKPETIRNLVDFIRELNRAFRRGIIEPLHDTPERYYLFRDTDEQMQKRSH